MLPTVFGDGQDVRVGQWTECPRSYEASACCRLSVGDILSPAFGDGQDVHAPFLLVLEIRPAISVHVNYFDPGRETSVHGDELPHWQQGAVMQFVTFRLKDALPIPVVRGWGRERAVWMDEHPLPWSEEVRAEYHRRFSARIESWLDQGMGSCLFANLEARKILADCLMRFEGERVRHEAWVIMPNHVHVLFTPLVPMEKLIQAWKCHSARLIGKGPIWQRNYRDTMIRDSNHFGNVLRYIRRNPTKAKLPEGRFSLWEREKERRHAAG